MNKPHIYEAYTVTFVEQPSFHSLDTYEDEWINELVAQIGIPNMILPRAKLFFVPLCVVH